MSQPGERAASRGVPSLVWRAGQERRLNLIRQWMPLDGAMALVDGCGIGMYVRALQQAGAQVSGLDVEHEHVALARENAPGTTLCQAAGEALPYPDNSFDLVLSHEVIEHVQDDRAYVQEMVRVLRRPGSRGSEGQKVGGSRSPAVRRPGAGAAKRSGESHEVPLSGAPERAQQSGVDRTEAQCGRSGAIDSPLAPGHPPLATGPSPSAGGRAVIFCPNRLYPFETHGHYWRGQYHFGNTPLINWLPDPLRNRWAPHVRAYSRRRLRALFDGLPVRVVFHSAIYPGYDNIAYNRPELGHWMQRVTYALEHTPLQWFGLSHFLVIERV